MLAVVSMTGVTFEIVAADAPAGATWDGFLARLGKGPVEADRVSLALNMAYREAVLRQPAGGVAWWIKESVRQSNENIRRAHAALLGAGAGPSRADEAGWRQAVDDFTRQYATEQARLAALMATDPSEIRLFPGEAAGWGLADRTIALTFDDGPEPGPTAGVLDVLRAERVPATFFLLGDKLERARESGTVPRYGRYPLGNHSWSHAYLPGLGPGALWGELTRTTKAFERAGLPRPQLFRAPYGARGARELSAAHQLGMRSVVWNVDSQDWQGTMQRRPFRIADRVAALVLLRRRGIVLMHDTRPTASVELKRFLEPLRAAGYCFTTNLH